MERTTNLVFPNLFYHKRDSNNHFYSKPSQAHIKKIVQQLSLCTQVCSQLTYMKCFKLLFMFKMIQDFIVEGVVVAGQVPGYLHSTVEEPLSNVPYP